MIKFKVSVKTAVKRGQAGGAGEGGWSAQMGDETPASAAAPLPARFEDPHAFRRRCEPPGGPPSAWPVPGPVIFAALGGALAWWCYYGYKYNQEHFPVSLAALLVFAGVVLVLLVLTLYVRELYRHRRMHPVLQRLAAQRPGAFVAAAGDVPALGYATGNWLGMVTFQEGGETEDAYTRLEARLRRPADRLEIRNRSIIEKLVGKQGPAAALVADGHFRRKFAVECLDPGGSPRPLAATITGAVAELADLGGILVQLDRDFVRVEVRKDLSGPWRERTLARFLALAETVVEELARRAG